MIVPNLVLPVKVRIRIFRAVDHPDISVNQYVHLHSHLLIFLVDNKVLIQGALEKYSDATDCGKS